MEGNKGRDRPGITSLDTIKTTGNKREERIQEIYVLASVRKKWTRRFWFWNKEQKIVVTVCLSPKNDKCDIRNTKLSILMSIF